MVNCAVQNFIIKIINWLQKTNIWINTSTILIEVVVSYSHSLNTLWVKFKVSEHLFHFSQSLVLC